MKVAHLCVWRKNLILNFERGSSVIDTALEVMPVIQLLWMENILNLKGTVKNCRLKAS